MNVKWKDYLADIKPRLDNIVASLTSKKEGTSSPTPEEGAKMKGQISEEKSEVEEDTPLQEEETEDDIRLQALFAQAERQIAQNESLVSSIKALNDASLKLLDERKA